MEFDEECKQRNESWFPKLMAYHAQYLETLLVAVGCHHLFGEFGLLEQLSSAGFALRRMTAEGEFLPYQLAR